MSAGRRWVRGHPVAVVVWGLFLAGLLVGPYATPDEARVREALEAVGPLAALAFVLAEALQVVVIPIPGQPLEIPGGYLFGFGAGMVLATVGSVAGSMIAFGLGRRLGRRWVERRVGAGERSRFARWLSDDERAEATIFWLMLVPIFPRDPLCYLAGMSGVRPARFAVIAALGRPVGLAPAVALGAGGVVSGLVVQILLAAGTGAAWLVWRRSGRRHARRSRRALPIGSHPPDGERHA